MNYQLSNEQKAFWQTNKFIKLNDFLTPWQKENLKKWCAEIQSLPETPGKWMQYFETNHHEDKKICRIENFLDYHFELNRLAKSPATIALLSELMGERAVLFKEKLNFKFAGSNGFKPHQDAPAFISFKQTYHITMMLAIDDADIENGCLEVIHDNPYKGKTLPIKSDGAIANEIADTLNWEPITCKSGDILLFDSYVPHYSKANHSNLSRRAMFFTYNRFAEGGDKRAAYYQDKREKFPPDCERDPNKDYQQGAKIYNVANPIVIE